MADKGNEDWEQFIWGNVRKCHGFRHKFLPAVHPDDQYALVRAESDGWFTVSPHQKYKL